MAHIHKAKAGTNGDVVVPFFANESPLDASSKSGCVQAKAAVVQGLAANPGNYYVNVHSPEFPKGAIRGQTVKLGANGDQLAFTGGPMSKGMMLLGLCIIAAGSTLLAVGQRRQVAYHRPATDRLTPDNSRHAATWRSGGRPSVEEGADSPEARRRRRQHRREPGDAGHSHRSLAGREGQATGDLPLPPPPAPAPVATGVIDGMLIGVLVWAIVVLTLLPALGASVAALFPTLLGALCAGGVVGPGVQAALRAGRSRRLPVAAAAGPAGGGSSSSAAGSVASAPPSASSSSCPGPPGWT